MMEAEIPGDIEGEHEEGALGLEDLGDLEKRGITILSLVNLARNAL